VRGNRPQKTEARPGRADGQGNVNVRDVYEKLVRIVLRPNSQAGPYIGLRPDDSARKSLVRLLRSPASIREVVTDIGDKHRTSDREGLSNN